MGVDPKRPLVGFALVAVLCAVLMALSVGRGSASLDLLHPGRPIAAPAERSPVEPAAEAPAAATVVSIPAELSPQPIGVVVTSARAERSTSGTVALESETVDAETASESTEQDETLTTDRKATKATTKATEKATEKAARKDTKATEKAARKSDRAAERADRKARREADRATRAAEKAAEKAARKG